MPDDPLYRRPLLPGMGNMYSPSMGTAGWELLTKDEKRAWWGQADDLSKDYLRAALEQSRIQPKKLGAPHSEGPPSLLRSGYSTPVGSMPNTGSLLGPVDVPIDVQRPTKKIMTGPLRQAIEQEVLGTPGREPTIPPPGVAARDAQLFGLGELDVAMDQAMAGGVLGDELFQYGEEFEGIYQYLKSKGVPEGKIDEFWKRTINEMGDFEGKTLWRAEGVDDLINTQTGEVVQGLRDPKGRFKIVKEQFTGGQPNEERMLREKTQELIDEGMHPLDAEIEVREKGVMRRTPEQQAFAIDDPIVMGKAWQAKEGTPQYKVVTERAVEWAGQHGRGQWQTDDPRARVSTEHPRFTEFHRDRLAQLRAASQAEAKIGQTIALDPITGEPGFPGQKFFSLPGDFPDPVPDPLRGQSRPSGMEQFLRDINAQRRGAVRDLTNLLDDELRALGNDILSRRAAGTATMADAMELQDVAAEVRRREAIKSGKDRFTYPRPRPGIETDLQSIIDDSLDIQIAGDAAGRRSQSLPATRAMLEGDVGPGRGGPRIARVPGDQPSLPGMGGEPPTKPPPKAIGGLGPEDYLYNHKAQKLYKEYWDLRRAGYVADISAEQLFDLNNKLRRLTDDLKKMGVPFSGEKMGRVEPSVGQWDYNPDGKSVLEGEPYVDTGLYMEDDPRYQAMEEAGPDRPLTSDTPGLEEHPGFQAMEEAEESALRRDIEKLKRRLNTELAIGDSRRPALQSQIDEWEAMLRDPSATAGFEEDDLMRAMGEEGREIGEAEIRYQEHLEDPHRTDLPAEGAGKPPGEPPVALAAGGADDFFPNNQSLNDAVNEFRAAGMTDEAAATLKAKALKKPKGWFPELTTWLRGKGGMRRASMNNLIDDVISTMRGTTLTLGQAATGARPTGRIVTPEDIYLGQEEMRAGEDLIHQIDADKLDEIIDVGDLARTQAAAETPLPQQTPEDIIRAGDQAFTDVERLAQETAGETDLLRQSEEVLTGFEDEAVGAVTNKQNAIIASDLQELVDNKIMSAGERAKYLDDLAKGEVRIMERMTVLQQKSLLRLMGETRKGHWADYPTRNAAYKKLIASNTLSTWALTRELLQANPSFRLSMREAVGWGMTAAEKTARGRGAITLGKNILGRGTVRGMKIAGGLGRLVTGPAGVVEMFVAGGQELDELNRGAGQTLMGGFRRPTPLQINVEYLNEEVSRRLQDPEDNFPWTRPHVLLEIAVSHNLIPDKDARELVDMLDGLMGINPRSDKTKQIANAFNKKLGSLLRNPAYEYDRLIDPVEDLPFQTKTDWISRVPVLNWFTDPYLLAGAGGSEAPWYINWAKNPRSLSRRVEQVRIKATAANAIESGHIPIQLAIMVAPDMRYQRVKKDEGMSALDWRLLEGVSIASGGVSHTRKDTLHEMLTEKPAGWREGDPLGAIKLSKEQRDEMIKHPQGRKLMEDLQSGKIIPINPRTKLPYRPRDPYTVGSPGPDPVHRPRFDPNVGTPPPDFKWVQASDKYSDLFVTTLGYNRAPTWAAYDKWKGTKTSQADAWSRAFRSQFGSPMGLGSRYSIEDFFAQYEDILDEMRSSGIGISNDGKGVDIYTMNLSLKKIPNPLVTMYTGQEVREGSLQKPRYSFTDNFDSTSRAYQTHKGIRQILPYTDPSYFRGGRELLRTGGGRY